MVGRMLQKKTSFTNVNIKASKIQNIAVCGRIPNRLKKILKIPAKNGDLNIYIP